MSTAEGSTGAGTWDTKFAAQKAAEALRYLGRIYPERLENTRVLDEHEEAANEAVLLGESGPVVLRLRAFPDFVTGGS